MITSFWILPQARYYQFINKGLAPTAIDSLIGARKPSDRFVAVAFTIDAYIACKQERIQLKNVTGN